MGKDVKLINACDHIVDEVTYEVHLCPKCFGKGYYFDIHFNGVGEAVLTEGDIKLQQEMIKIILEDRYSNKFHELWGSDLKNMVGSKNLEINKTKIEVIVRNTLSYLKNLQLAETKEWNNLDNSEILDTVDYILVTKSGLTGYIVDVSISNKAGSILIQNIQL